MVPKFFIRTGLIRGAIQKIISGIFPILKGFDKPIERFVKGDISGIIVLSEDITVAWAVSTLSVST